MEGPDCCLSVCKSNVGRDPFKAEGPLFKIKKIKNMKMHGKGEERTCFLGALPAFHVLII